MHTFCERCIHSYIIQETKKRPQASGIRCPICRKETTSPAPTKPATEWAAALTVNYALLPALEPDDDVITGRKCDPCLADNKVRGAMSYCQDCGDFQCEECLSVHRRFAKMKRHVFIDIEHRLTTDWTPTSFPEHVPIAERQVRKMPLFDIRKTVNFGQPGYRGVVVLPGGQVVATVWKNYLCCRLDDTCNMTSHIKLSSYPSSLTMIGDTDVAVVLHNESKLLCVSVLPHLTATRTISLSRTMCVARVSDTELAVGWYNAGFSIVTMEGTEIKHIQRDTSCRKIKIDSGDSITVDVSRQHLFRSSGTNNAVYCCDLTGKTVFDYTNNKLKRPRGLTLDQDGNVYVCSQHTDSVHQISPEGTLIRVIDTGMKEPFSLCLYPDGQHMLVMNWIWRPGSWIGTTHALKVRFEPQK